MIGLLGKNFSRSKITTFLRIDQIYLKINDLFRVFAKRTKQNLP